MTTKARRYRLAIIVIACGVLITLFSLIQTMKTNSEETAAFESMEGYVLTSQGIQKIEQDGDTVEHIAVLEKNDIMSFNILDNDTLVYSALLNPADRTQFNIYLYDLRTKETKPVFEGTADIQYTDMLAVGRDSVGVIRHLTAENIHEIILFDIATGEEQVVSSPVAEKYITSWTASPDGRSLAFKGVANDTYYYDRQTQEVSLIGTFDNVYGFLDSATAWLSNIADDSKMSVYNVKSKQVKPVDFSDDLAKKTFINGTLLSAGPPEEVLWTVSGFFDTETASQKIITTDGKDFSVLYDLTANGYKFLNTVPSLDESKELVAIDAVNENDQNVILIVGTSSGKLLNVIEGRHFVVTS